MSTFRYHLHRFWSPLLGCEAARISVADAQGGEFWSIIPAGGRGWRKRRAEAIGLLCDAIEGGKAPGEVKGAERPARGAEVA